MCEKTKGEEVIQLSCLVSGSLLCWQLVSGRVTESAAADTTLAAVDTSGGVALLRDKIYIPFLFLPKLTAKGLKIVHKCMSFTKPIQLF